VGGTLEEKLALARLDDDHEAHSGLSGVNEVSRSLSYVERRRRRIDTLACQFLGAV
jgi:hypothetical protein